MTLALIDILEIYQGSDGVATKALYEKLERLGPIGAVAVNVFRANKASARAKVYRGKGYKSMAYDRKSWSINNLTKVLTEHAARFGIGWGWKEDSKQVVHRWVFYIDLPTGQVSFHSEYRGDGPDYPGEWDGVRAASPSRICGWIANLLIEQKATG